MSENLTRKHDLIKEITNKNWFANPAGKQGYEVILLERVGDGGTRFYHSLKAGETLRIAERVFSNFIAFEVDIRQGHVFTVDTAFNIKGTSSKLFLNINVRSISKCRGSHM